MATNIRSNWHLFCTVVVDICAFSSVKNKQIGHFFCVDKFYHVGVIFVIKNRLFLWSCPKEKLSCYCMRVFFTKFSLAPVQNSMNYGLVSKECNIVICKRFANCFVLNGLFQAVNWRIFSLKINRATQNTCFIVLYRFLALLKMKSKRESCEIDTRNRCSRFIISFWPSLLICCVFSCCQRKTWIIMT